MRVRPTKRSLSFPKISESALKNEIEFLLVLIKFKAIYFDKYSLKVINKYIFLNF